MWKSALYLSILTGVAVALSEPELFTQTLSYNPNRSFTDVIDRSGIDALEPVEGAAWADYDNDGFLDLFLFGRRRFHLYKNTGKGTFIETTKEAEFPSLSGAGSVGDYDNDGCVDVFFERQQPAQRALFRNLCDGTFKVAERKTRFAPFTSGRGSAWADYDSNGYVDLYVANYGRFTSKTEYLYEPNVLYRNNGDGSFTDVTQEAGVPGYSECGVESGWRKRIKVTGKTLKESFQPLWFDYDSDGSTDLFVATDSGVSPLYKNRGDGTFTEVTKEAGLCRVGTGMGATAGDYDSDGDMDLYVTNVGINFFWRNNGDGTFTEIGAEAKTKNLPFVGWGAEFIDYDNDGDLDLYAVNGQIQATEPNEYRELGIGEVRLDRLYENLGDGTFQEVSERKGLYGDFAKEVGAFGDYDNNGFIDAFIASDSSAEAIRNQLYKNRGNRNHWLTMELRGTKSNRSGIGARITVTAEGRTQLREVVSGSSFLAQASPWQTFGLGKAAYAGKVEVRWPSGITTVLEDVEANQKVIILEQQQ